MFNGFRKTTCEETFTCLFETYKEKLFAYVLAISHSHYVAEEITQEIFLKLWLTRNDLHLINNPEAYLLTIARNKLLNHLRKCRYDEKLLQEIKNSMNQAGNNVEEETAAHDCDRLLQEAITLLSPQQRHVYLLSRKEGLDHTQIASQLQLSKNTVKNHLVRALSFIRYYLGNHGVSILILFLLAA